jgi:hypothetical protein
MGHLGLYLLTRWADLPLVVMHTIAAASVLKAALRAWVDDNISSISSCNVSVLAIHM